MNTAIKVYSAESSVRHPRLVIRDMFRGLLQSRYMAYRLCVKDIRSENAKSAFGFLWDFVDPFVFASIFYFLARIRVMNPGALHMPYAVFVIYGLLLYQTFAESVTLSMDAMRRSKTILTHLKLPPEALILSVFYRVLFNSSFRIAVMLVFSLVLYETAAADGQSTFTILGFIKFVILYPILIFGGMSFGVLLAPFSAIYADVGRITKIVLTPLRYASPVLYAIPSAFPFNWISMVNPIGPIIQNLRSLATSDSITDLPGLAIRCFVFLVVFSVGWLIFHLAVPVLAEKA
jgi:lipopolysaccharide transport system permease protein